MEKQNMAMHAIKKTTEARSPERQALAHAIEAVAQAERAEENGRAAVARAVDLVNAGSAKLAEARVAVVAAKEQHTAAVAAAIGKGTAVPAGTLKSARAAEADAEDDLAAATAALEQLQTALADLGAETGHAKLSVEAAINGVLAGAAPQLVAAITARRAELLELLSISWFVRSRGGERHGSTFQSSEIPALRRPLATATAEIDPQIQVGTGAWGPDAALAHPSVGRWHEAVVALRTDPDAPLPTER
jgi:hypothetical protein